MTSVLRIQVPRADGAIRLWFARDVLGPRLGTTVVAEIADVDVWRFEWGDERFDVAACRPSTILDAAPCSVPGIDGVHTPDGQVPWVPRNACLGSMSGTVRIAWLDIAASLMAWLGELGRGQDAHGRVPVADTWMGRHGLVEAPIADWCIDAVRRGLRAAGAHVDEAPTAPVVHVSHDVDIPFAARPPGPLRIGRAWRDAVLGRFGVDRFRALARVIASSAGLARLDPLYTFEDLCADHEAHGRRATWYFIANGDHPLDGRYRLGDPEIHRLLRDLVARGHRIGVHGGYATWDNADELRRQHDLLSEALGESMPGRIGGRQHYLRWRPETTPAVYAEAGLTHDGTPGFAEAPGFRCGTAHPYPAFDVQRGMALPVTIEPLHLMEVSVYAPRYLGHDWSDPAAHARIDRVRARCAAVGGRFSVLWHNSELRSKAAWAAYRHATRPMSASEGRVLGAMPTISEALTC